MHSSSVTRAPKSQLGDEQPSTGGLWNLPKNIQTEEEKKTQCPKTQKKPQWDGRWGRTMIESNPPDRWVTHKLESNNAKEVLPLLWTF